MELSTLAECLEEIRGYIAENAAGFPLIINTDNFEDFSNLRERLESDASIEKIYISELMKEDGLPNLSDLYGKLFEKGVRAVIGVSNALSLKGEVAIKGELRQLAHTLAYGHVIILLSHSESYLRELMQEDPRIKRQIVFWNGTTSPLPTIILVNGYNCDKKSVLPNIKSLIYELERYSGIPENKEFSVATKFSPATFAHSLYRIEQEKPPYEKLKQKYPELRDIGEEYGKDSDWAWLYNELQKSGTLEYVVKNYFVDTGALLWQLPKELGEKDEKGRWLYWLALNIYPPKGEYFRFALSRSNSLSELENELYFALFDINWEDEDFKALYSERKEILGKISANQNIVIRYCNNVGQKDKAAVYYLTDKTEFERIKLLKCLSAYEYTDKELDEILKQVAPELEIYLRPYKIALQNIGTAFMEDDILSAVSAYFTEYKKQKLTNKIKEEFLSGVEEYANSRPYNKFLTRLALLNKLSVKDAKVFFFDALGVEYLSYIAAKCEEIGFMADIKIGRGELPSITT